MQRNLNLQTHERSSESSSSTHRKEFKKETSEHMTRDWISAFNTSLLTTLTPSNRDRNTDLTKLMQSPEFSSLLVAARHLADAQGLTMEEATDRLIRTFRDMDQLWKQIVMERGLKAIID